MNENVSSLLKVDIPAAFRRRRQIAAVIALLTVTVITGCSDEEIPPPETDEAMKRATAENVDVVTAAGYFTYHDGVEVADYFKGMDSVSDPTIDTTHPDQLVDLVEKRPDTSVQSPELSRSETIGRNTWMAWCGGNEGFWDWLGTDSLGFVDLLKVVDSRTRSTRFRDAGMINEPGMEQAGAPSAEEFGLWLDVPSDPRTREWRKVYLSQTFEQILAGQHKSQVGLMKGDEYGPDTLRALFLGDANAFKGETYLYPSQYFSAEIRKRYELPDKYGYDRKDDYGGDYVKYENHYDQTIPPPDMYGISSGVVGLRLFPNPYFDKEASEQWDADRYYDKEDSYSTDPDLVRPFRVGMACSFCHASFHPLNPPLDVHSPEWENISGSIGAQYLRMRATVGNLLEPDNFVYHLLDSEPPGTVDTSLVASDNLNNPNAMNAVFSLRERAILSLFNPREEQSPASAKLPSLYGNLTPKESDGDGDDGYQNEDDDQSADEAAAGADDYPNPDESADAPPVVPCPLDYAPNDHIPTSLVEMLAERGLLNAALQSNCNPRGVPRILLDGADSIGTWGALARVYLNIGTYWEQWNQIHQVVLGFTPQRPFTISDCETNSVYWNATSYRVPGLRDYFLKVTPPMPLLSIEDGVDRLKPVDPEAIRQAAQAAGVDVQQALATERRYRVDASQLSRGRQVFAENCIVCHSSIQPETMMLMEGMQGTKELRDLQAIQNRYAALGNDRNTVRYAAEENGEFWEHNPVQWLENSDYLAWALEVVNEPAFWQWNYLSNDYRIPINVVETNSARAMATNGMTGHMWQDFASESYRNMPSVGVIDYFNPYAGENGAMEQFTPRHRVAPGVPEGGGGPGFYRTPTLVSIWATAPYLHNNSLGTFNNDPSVTGRLDAFDDGIRKLLWPRKRLESSSYNDATPERLEADHGLIWRTTEETYLSIDGKRVPHVARSQLQSLAELQSYNGFRWLHFVQPLWLPSLILLLGAFIILKVSHGGKRTTYALLILAVAIALFVLHWLARRYPETQILIWFRPMLPVAIAIAVLLVLAYLSWRLNHAIWSALLAGTAVVVFVLHLIARFFPDVRIANALNNIYPVLLPTVTLFIVAIILLLPLSRKWTRCAGYLSVVFSLLIGLVVYFNAGELGDVTIGPIPKGTPVNLLANFNSEADRDTQIESITAVVDGLAEIKSRHLPPEEAERVMKEKIAPALMAVNKCPDFVMDHGHDFPWFESMTDDDKEALIELLKTF